MLSDIARFKIKFDNRFEKANRVLNKLFFSLDGTDFPINEPVPFSSKWKSHKFKGAALRYEIGLCLRTSNIVWAFGGVPAGEYPDLELARIALIDRLEPGELVVADNGYHDRIFFVYDRKGVMTPRDTMIRKYFWHLVKTII